MQSDIETKSSEITDLQAQLSTVNKMFDDEVCLCIM